MFNCSTFKFTSFKFILQAGEPHIEHSHWRGFIQVYYNDWFDHCRYTVKLHQDDDYDDDDGDDGDDDDDDDDDVTIWVFESDLVLMSYY